jgi:DNA-binding response OmpR family regulator
MMPPPNGLEVLRRLRRADDWIPVLMLTANTDETDKIVGLELGADDYVAKTSSPRELAARLKALTRRSATGLAGRPGDEGRPVRVDELSLIPSERRADLAGLTLPLTSTEFGVLHYLMRHAGTVIAKEDLSRTVLGRGLSPYDRALDVHVSHIRKKLAVHDNWRNRIQAVRGIGYQLLVSA